MSLRLRKRLRAFVTRSSPQRVTSLKNVCMGGYTEDSFEQNLAVRRLLGSSFKLRQLVLKRGVYLGVKTCEVFLCFVAIVRVRIYYVDFIVFFVLRHC